MPEMRITGAEQLRKLSADLAAAGEQGKRLRARMGRNMRVTARPVVAEVKRNLRNIPVKGGKSTGLRAALARATRASVRTAGRNVGVRVITDGQKMPAGQQNLPAKMEGDQRWRKPLYGDREHWYPQDAHPTVRPTVEKKLPEFQAALIEAIDETALALEHGGA